MSSVLIKLLQSLDLSRTEREVAKRYEVDPGGRAFLPVADILRAHGHSTEAIEVLMHGVELHPSFTVARVVLARELYSKGMISDARRILDESVSPLRDNILAQKLYLKIYILLHDESAARTGFEYLKVNRLLDAETRRYGEIIELQGFRAARQRLIKDLADSGVDLQPSVRDGSAQASSGVYSVAPAENLPPQVEIVSDDELELRDMDAIAGFHAVPLKDIFNPSDLSTAPALSFGGAQPSPQFGGKSGVELDSTTLAEIYARQGHYSKALGIYRRLLKISPQNELLRRKIAEIQVLERKQREMDEDVDLAIADRVETLEVIDAQIRFYHDLLGVLGG